MLLWVPPLARQALVFEQCRSGFAGAFLKLPAFTNVLLSNRRCQSENWRNISIRTAQLRTQLNGEMLLWVLLASVRHTRICGRLSELAGAFLKLPHTHVAHVVVMDSVL